jgi:hypothetical protein
MQNQKKYQHLCFFQFDNSKNPLNSFQKLSTAVNNSLVEPCLSLIGALLLPCYCLVTALEEP